MSGDLNAMYEKYQERFKGTDKAARKKMTDAIRKDEDYQKLIAKYRELWEKLRKYSPDSDRHGYVWVVLRK